MSDVRQEEDWLIDDTAQPAMAGAQLERSWKVLIIDDEQDVHLVTQMALRNLKFRGRALEMLSAYSASTGFELLQQHPDTAIALLDVVMETDDAGLRLVQRIRQELNNHLVRIVLRTGQPGQAPEQRVIVEYDINDYKAKTELTTQKLFTTVIASLRTYESLLTIEMSRQGLGKILEGAANLYQYHSLQDFASGVLAQISAILNVGADGVLCAQQRDRDNSLLRHLIAGTGQYAGLIADGSMTDSHSLAPLMQRAFAGRRSFFEHPYDVLYISAQKQHEFVILFSPPWPLAEYQKDLLNVFCNRIAAALDNLYLYQQLKASHEATVVALADLAEYRDATTGNHILRVQRMTDAVAHRLRASGHFPDDLNESFLSMVGTAAILHDVGKVATPDHILLKPGKHDPEERSIMQQHAASGQTILARAATMVDGDSYLSYGAQIAGGHHEHYDGGGYPLGLCGDAIPLAAKIVAVVDVFDALVHRRPYKEPWPINEALTYIRDRAGSQFDPYVVKAFLDVVAKDPSDWIDLNGL